jgi:serine/threonine protein kinase
LVLLVAQGFKLSESEIVAFEQEVALLEFMKDSPFIVKLVGYCRDPLCIILKFYREGSLERWYKRQKRRNHVKLNILNDISKGILELHERQVSHSDLKPLNVLVEELKDRVHFVLTDFGISKILTKEYLASLSFKTNKMQGISLLYAAPDAVVRFREKIPGSATEEKAADVFSLGMITYFVLLKRNPWQ